MNSGRPRNTGGHCILENSCTGKDPTLVSWSPPPYGWIKLNTDGCLKGKTGLAAAGGLFRDVSGNWVLGFATKVGYSTDILVPELWAISIGLKLAVDKGFSNLVVESDCLAAIDLLSKPSNPLRPQPTLNLIEDCKSLMSKVSNCVLNHNLREGNSCADFMANLGTSLSQDIHEFTHPPDGVQDSLMADALAVSSPQVEADRPFANDTFGRGDGMSRGRGNYPKLMSQGSSSNHSNHNPTSGYLYRGKKPVPDDEDGFSHTGKFWQVQYPPEAGDSGPKQSECFVASDIVRGTDLQSLLSQLDSKKIHMDVRTVQIGQIRPIGQIRRAQVQHKEDSATLHVDFSFSATLHVDFSRKVNISSLINEYELPSESGTEDQPSQEKGPEKIEGIKDSGPSEHVEPFDICLPKTGTTVVLKPSLLVRNRGKQNENKRSMEEQNESILRPGMILLKNYLSMGDQVKIVKACRDLGLGPGGFYQPGYSNGAKLHLKMMCLGKNWDPETREYGDLRPIDDAKPPIIPREFFQLVEKAIKDSHALIERDSKRNKVEEILPRMSPSICIVNFYSASGRLGLHQDKDESRGSLDKGLPVVSFSLGDSAEFLYGDQRDVDKAQKVELKSGDVLIYGGKSRHIFHGVTAIIPNTAPKTLLEETNLRPGRLNLTFREC